MTTATRSQSGASSTTGEPRTPPSKLKLLAPRGSPYKSTSPRRPSFINSNHIVTINIAKEGKTTTFSVHKSYLTAYSEYFKAALNGSWSEAETMKFELQDISPQIFDVFVAWAYTQKIVDSAGNTPIFRHLMELWLLGDRFQIRRLQNEAIEAMNTQAHELKRHCPSYHHVYENTVNESPLRLFLAALSSQALLKEVKTIDSPENFPHQMLIDMMNWTAKHHKKLAKFCHADLVQFFVAEDEATSVIRNVGSYDSPYSLISPAGSFFSSPSSTETL